MQVMAEILHSLESEKTLCLADRLLGCFNANTKFFCFLRRHYHLGLANSSFSSLATCGWTSLCNSWNFGIHVWS